MTWWRCGGGHCWPSMSSSIPSRLTKYDASSFPLPNRYLAKKPSLSIAIIPRERAVLKFDREEELISSNFTITRREPLEAQSVPRSEMRQAFQAVFPCETLRNRLKRRGQLNCAWKCSKHNSSTFKADRLLRGHWEICGAC